MKVRRGHRGTERSATAKNPMVKHAPRCRTRAEKGGGAQSQKGVRCRCRHVALGAETNGGGWRVAGAGDVQERGCVKQVYKKRPDFDHEWLRMGRVVGWRRQKKDPEKQ